MRGEPQNPVRSRRGGEGFMIRPMRWIALLLLLVLPWNGCASDGDGPQPVPPEPTIRVLLEDDLSQAELTIEGPVQVSAGGHRRTLNLQGRYPVRRGGDGWVIGTESIAGRGPLQVVPRAETSVALNDERRPGTLHFVAGAGSTFDVVNHVGLDQYIAGVVSGEMFANWHLNALKAQAVAARTYALFQKQTLDRGHFDVYGDTRDQAYAPIDKWTDNDRRAARETAGVVLAWSAEGQPRRIFKAYYSSTAGGPSIGAVDAFGDSPINRVGPINTEVDYGTLDAASKRYRWTISTTKSALSQAIRQHMSDTPLAQLGPIDNVQVDARNALQRPTRYVVVDRAGKTATLSAERMRYLLNRVGSSYGNWVEPRVQGETLTFEGRGFGHGVGMSQYAAEALAQKGVSWDRILRFCYPGADLVRAYQTGNLTVATAE